MIEYRVGDATCDPSVKGVKIIAHGCNDVVAWGRGFVLAISRRWKEPERYFRSNRLDLGGLQLIQVESEVWVANLGIQHGVKSFTNKDPCIKYEALEEALSKLSVEALKLKATVMMPRIGCGLAGGTWDKVGPIVEKTLEGIQVICYDYPS